MVCQLNLKNRIEKPNMSYNLSAAVATGANKPSEHDSSKDNRSVFVSNLSYDATDDEIKEVLGPNAVEVKLVKDFKVMLKFLPFFVNLFGTHFSGSFQGLWLRGNAKC
jgi:RNA recognition motif-containing protein